MDVTSLLNSSSLVKGEAAIGTKARSMVDHVINSTSIRADGVVVSSSSHDSSSHEKTSPRRTSDPKVPIRSRTPWDANGYALPLMLDTKLSQAPARPKSNSTSPAESGSPKSPQHKCSGSHSSLSSYTSSSTSLSHSRISSMSTVGGMQPISSIPDTTSLETQFECAELPMPKIWSSSSDIPQKAATEEITPPPANNGGTIVTDCVRSGSPSDAMLISRGTQSLDRVKKQEVVVMSKDFRSNHTHLIPLDFAKAHKRAISAPILTATDTIDRKVPPFSSVLQPIPSPLQQGGFRSSYAMEGTNPPAELPGHSVSDGGIFCMYKPNCDTGSQLRKAISHIFGRNKTCTRNIPSHVWVHFCRKHYQRSRYRNAQEWARVQCDLVLKQIHRVQDWSDDNKRSGQGGVVQEWSLSMRKREQNRVQGKSSKKRSYPNESEDDEDDVPDTATMNGTAVPDWLRSKCGDGYSTAEIGEIMARLKQEMEETNMTQIPDIEILPNISMNTSDNGAPKVTVKRKTSSGGPAHKRSQSVGVTLRPEPQPMTRRVSQPMYWKQNDSMRLSPVEKRQRVSDAPSYRDGQAHTAAHTAPRYPERPALAPLRPTHTLPHRPSFNNIQESRAEDPYYASEDARAPQYGYDHWSASASQQNGAQTTVVSSESTMARDYIDGGRMLHHRSYPEAETPQHNFTFRSQLGYPPMSQESASYNRGPAPSGHLHSGSAPSNYYEDRPALAQRSFSSYQSQPPWTSPTPGNPPQYPNQRHARHQSTPSSSHGNTPHIPSIEYEHASSARQIAYEQSPPYHRRQRSYAQSPQYSRRAPVLESDQAKAVFSERR